MSTILIKNGTVVTLGDELKVLPNYSVLIENDKIKKIAPDGEITETAEKTIDAKNKVVMPGFINAHMHFYSSFARGLGKAEPSANFTEVLENLWWRLDKKLSLDDNYYSAMIACIDAIKKGTTTLIDHHASPFEVNGSLNAIADAVKDSGLRASLCYELSDRDGHEISEAGINENVDFIKRLKEEPDDQLHGMFGMHASFTIEKETMEKACKLAKELDVGIHIHTAEDKADQTNTMKMTGKKVVKRLYDSGALGPKTICAHCVHVDDEELNLLQETDTIVVHNPQSNMNNAVGVADIFKMLEKGITVGLGTDAMTVNMLEELRSCLWIHKIDTKNPSAGFMEALNLLITNNKKIADRFWPSLGLGELKEGNKADVILMDYHSPTQFDESTFGGHLIFGLSQSTVDTTIAGGKVLMENKKITSLNEEEIYQKCRDLSKELWDRF